MSSFCRVRTSHGELLVRPTNNIRHHNGEEFQDFPRIQDKFKALQALPAQLHALSDQLAERLCGHHTVRYSPNTLQCSPNTFRSRQRLRERRAGEGSLYVCLISYTLPLNNH